MIDRIIISNPDNNPLINHLQGELDIALADGKNPEELSDIVSAISDLLYKGYDYNQIKVVLNKAINFLNRQVIIPLNLSIGEFVYTSYNLSTNRRNNAVKMNSVGIFYENAYVNNYVNAFDSYTDARLPIEYLKERTPYKDYTFIMSGGKITNNAFKICYLKQETVKKKSFYPANPIKLDTRAYIHKNEYISVIRFNNPKFKALQQLYDVQIETINDEYLKHFGVTFNISKDELFSKRTSVRISRSNSSW